MRLRRGVGRAHLLLATLALAGAGASSGLAQAPTEASVPVTFTVTAVGGGEAPALSKTDVQLFVENERRPVGRWASDADLHLAILIDDAVARGAAERWSELRQFILAQPAETRVAVGYLRNHVAVMAQDFTTDHEAAAAALRAPRGVGGPSSPYRGVADLLSRWPRSGPRRSILLISPGADFFRGVHQGPALRDVDPLIQTAQTLNVNVWTIFYPGGGHRGRNFTHVSNGQDNLARLADETGGEFHTSGPGEPASLTPYLDEVAAHLGRQSLLTFAAVPGKSRRRVGVYVRAEAPDVEFLFPSAVDVPAAK
jgi:hypothetical protein